MTALRARSLRAALDRSPPSAGDVSINPYHEKGQPKVVRSIKMLVYSHDTFGLGNIRRMIAICEHLKTRIPEISVLVLTGSPMLHSFRLTDGIDYVKLPCLRRDAGGAMGVKYLNLSLDSTVRLRRELIFSTVTYLRPDIFLIDKNRVVWRAS
jgi:predicted glycosyltransferase